MLNMMRNLWKDEEGPTAVEYALIVTLIAVAIIVGATALGGKINTAFTDVSGQIKGK